MKVTTVKIIATVSVVFAIVACYFIWHNFLNSGLKEKDSENNIVQSEQLFYLHSDNSFGFQFPSNLKFSNLIGEVNGEVVETVLFTGGKTEQGFQIHITQYDSGVVTSRAIAAENPQLTISDVFDIAIGNIPAVAFVAEEKGSSLKTREVWFERNGKLYQVSGYSENDEELTNILVTWNWNE
jgi:hypothetical protein